MSTEYVYICFASTGEYSDRTEWTLHGYKTEQEAKDFVERVDATFKELWVQCLTSPKSRYTDHEKRYSLFEKGWFPECPELAEPDYTGFYFWYDTVEIR